MVKRMLQRPKTLARKIDLNRRNEIIGAIVAALRPLKADFLSEPVETNLNHDIDLLIKIIPLQKSILDRQLIRRHTQKIERALVKLQASLESAPEPVLSLLFPPARYENIKSTEEFVKNFKERIEPFFSELERVREACKRDFGLHPNYDQTKGLCADFAHGFIQNLSEQPISGTENGSFRTIAGLLYEIVSGTQDADLKRSCDKLISFMNGKR